MKLVSTIPLACGLLFVAVDPRVVDAFSPLQPSVRHAPALARSTTKTIRFATVPEEKEQVKTSSDDILPRSKKTPSLFDGVPYEELTIGVLREDLEGENRVSQTPDSVRNLVKAGFTVIVEQDGE